MQVVNSSLRALLLCSATLLPSYGYAQVAGSAPTAPAAEQQAQPQASASGGLEDIIVMARKQAENVQNIPVAVTVVTPAQIQNLNINTIEKLSVLAPQLIVGRNATGSGASISLRGITVNATSVSLEQSVAVVIDGVYIPGGRLLNLGLFDIAQIEVLKGPQSLFYGKNTTAGAISITTADPTPDFQGMTRVGYEFNARQPYVEAMVSGPLTQTLGLRLAGGYSKQFGALIDNVTVPGVYVTRDVATGVVTTRARPTGDPDTPGERNAHVRGTLKWSPTPDLTATLKVGYNDYHTSTSNSAGIIAFCETGFIQTDPTAVCGKAFRQTQAPVPADVAAANPIQGRHGGNLFMDYKALTVSGNLVYNAPQITLSLVPAFTRQRTYAFGDIDFTNNYLSNNGNIAGSSDLQRAYSAEFRAQTHTDSPLDGLFGLFYQNSLTGFTGVPILPRSQASGGGAPENSAASDPSYRFLGLIRNGETRGETIAAFGQLLLDITPSLNIAGGARYTYETKDSFLDQPYVNPDFLSQYRVGRLAARQAFRNLSPEATVTWKPNRDVTVFGSYRTGYKSGGFSVSGLISPTSTSRDPQFNPELVSGFEGGVKSTLFDRQLRVNATAFNYLYRGIQVDFLDPATIQFVTQNAARARTKGVELDMQFAPRAVPKLNLRASGAYTDGNYLSFPSAPCLGGQRPAEGCNQGPVVAATGAFSRQNLSGADLAQAPKWTGTAGADYNIAVGSRNKIGLSVNARYSSRYKIYGFAPDTASRFYQPRFVTIDASIGFGAEDDRWLFQVIGKNLTNRFIATTGYDLTGTGARAGLPTGIHSDVRTAVSDPRTVAAQLTVKF